MNEGQAILQLSPGRAKIYGKCCERDILTPLKLTKRTGDR